MKYYPGEGEIGPSFWYSHTRMKDSTTKVVVAGSLLSAVGLLTYAWWPIPPRARFLKVAGGEEGSENWQKYVDNVTTRPPTERPHWCGIFALWALHKAGFACDWKWDLANGRGFLHKLPRTSNPQPGDMAYLHAYNHHAIVEKVDGNMIHTIDGNSGPRPTRVLRNVRPRNTIAFFYDTSQIFNNKC